ncbi:hypothetical protein [Metabacillus fastidiosus]|uniref:hypothetical protein n=1 Tax=Metabacillus fastidiosus TaxID=1458 RepID=UPI003D2CC2CC
MRNLIETISKYPNGELFTIEWSNGFKIEAELDTLYETNNGLEEDEPGYREYHASLFIIKKIFSHSTESKKLGLSGGTLYEVSMEELPIRLILSTSGKLIWQNSP